MSWEDKIEKKLTITTGDGKIFDVIWINATQSIEWHGSEFSFLEVDGTYARKKKVLGRKFPLEFYFQGPNHLDEFKRFSKSCGDTRPCVIEHPLYDVITAQIFSLNVDNTTMNYSKVTATAIETITDENPITVIDPVDSIDQKKVSLDLFSEAELSEPPSLSDVNTLNLTNEQSYKQGVKIITIPEEAQDYFNALSTASNYVNTITASPILAMRATISLLTLPSKFTANVKSRVGTLASQFVNLRRTIIGLSTVPSKQLYEIQGSALISSMCLAASTPLSGDYKNSTSALNIVDSILSNYKLFLDDIDSLQDTNGSDPIFFIPGFDLMSQLNDLINLTVSSLIDIALSGRQERSLILTEDNNLIKLTHLLYSLDPSDANMVELMENNNLTWRQMLGIDKGTKIIYYI
jgi:hypothetical protein